MERGEVLTFMVIYEHGYGGVKYPIPLHSQNHACALVKLPPKLQSPLPVSTFASISDGSTWLFPSSHFL